MKVGNQEKVVSYYSPEAIAALDKLAADKRITKANLLREALDDLIAKYAKPGHSATTKSTTTKARKKS